ncbi:DUF1573 domain-containing protein [Saccharicrinis aurantiacus]|uniref:DUF1573 domain-containing protein n=1 Tax=Saccharicrinis aurantiacus TaxID=1849719 RepID=UPI00094F5BE5|nr:DUF1573 domain-containing protein [Saccharicrinis aurantiacus]
MKHLILSLMALFIVSTTWAQSAKPSFSFNKTLHDFGAIKEADGKVSYKFTFKNTGAQPLVVHNVRASCGCTTPDWSKQPIAPGASGYVKATFDPKNRPGNFNKTITVTANTDPGNTVLRITGNVQQREKTLADIYPRELGPLRLKTSHLSFTKITPQGKKTEEIEVINDSKEAISISFGRVPNHITITASPAKLAPGQKGKFIASYDASKKQDWGFVYDQIFVNINDEVDYKKRISINANIQEDFANWTDDQKENAPKISVDNKIFDFGEIKQGAKAEHTFVITNSGKSNLIIRKVKASCGCTAVTPDKKVIGPGESTNVKASFNSQGKTGRQNKSVTVITNDPMASNILLRVQGNVN